MRMNPCFIVYLFLEKLSTKCNAHLLVSSSKQDMVITNSNATCDANVFMSFLSFAKKDKLASLSSCNKRNL